jgi:hypothetical protein
LIPRRPKETLSACGALDLDQDRCARAAATLFRSLPTVE